MDIFKEIIAIKNSGTPCVLVTVIKTIGASSGKKSFKMIVLPDGKTIGTVGGGDVERIASQEALKVLKSEIPILKEYDLDKLKMECGGRISMFYDFIPAERQLLIFGGGHVGQALYKVAKDVSFNTRVYDDRENLKSQFDEQDFVLCNFENLPVKMFPVSNSYVSIMTYNHKYDYTVLKQVLKCGKSFKYIGLIGSNKKVEAAYKNLIKEGINIPDNLYAPIGLDIGAKTAEEIAVAIMGEIIGVANKKEVDSMRKSITRKTHEKH